MKNLILCDLVDTETNKVVKKKFKFTKPELVIFNYALALNHSNLRYIAK